MGIGFVGGGSSDRKAVYTAMAGSDFSSIGAGTWIGICANSIYITGWLFHNSSATDHDELFIPIWLPAGTYTVRHIGYVDADKGKCDVFIDSTKIEDAVDWYAAGIDNHYHDTAHVAISEGYHSIRVYVNGQNVASSGYSHTLYAFQFIRE